MLTDLRRFKSGSVSGPLRFVHFTSIPLARIGQSLDRAALNRRGGYSRDRSACALIDWLWVPFIILPNKRLLFHQNLDPIALYPLDAAHGTKEIRDRLGAGVASNVYAAPGPDGNIDSSYEFLGTSANYIEFPNGAGLDAKNSMTMLGGCFREARTVPSSTTGIPEVGESISGLSPANFLYALLKEIIHLQTPCYTLNWNQRMDGSSLVLRMTAHLATQDCGLTGTRSRNWILVQIFS